LRLQSRWEIRNAGRTRKGASGNGKAAVGEDGGKKIRIAEARGRAAEKGDGEEEGKKKRPEALSHP